MVFNWIKKHTSQDSIVFFQETHSDESLESIWKSQWHGEIEFSHGVNDARGTLICFREGLEYKILNKYNFTFPFHSMVGLACLYCVSYAA